MRKLTTQFKLYNAGLRPVFKPCPGDEPWNTIPGELSWKQESDGFLIEFEHVFTEDHPTVFFSFTYPFSYQEVIEMTDNVEQKCEDQEGVYFKRELLVHSLEKRKVELLTLTDTSEMTEEEEPLIKG